MLRILAVLFLLTGAAFAHRVTLVWNASPTTDVISYNVYRSTTPGSGYVLIGNATIETFTDSIVTNGVTYYYVVTAVDPYGESGYSNQAAATIPMPPKRPANLKATLK